MLDWDEFRLFLAIAREGTLTGAARQLAVDQSTVSRRLVALEASAGTRLFDRTPEGYVPTAAGESVRERVEDIERRATEVERVLVGQDAKVEGRVRFATSDSFAAWFVVKYLAALRQKHPGLVVELVTGNRAADLARRDADVSLRLGPPSEPNLVARKLGKVAWALYASADYVARRGLPRESDNLKGHDVVAYSEELAGTAGARWLKQHGRDGTVVAASNSLLSQAAAVVAGLGVSCLPCVFGDTEPSLRRLPPGLVGHHDAWLVFHPDFRSSARVRAVADFFVDRVTEHADLLAGNAPARPPAARRKRPRA